MEDKLFDSFYIRNEYGKLTNKKAKAVYKSMGTDGIFGRSDISSITGDSVTAAGNLISKLKTASLIVPVKGYGKGKYRFIKPHK